MPVHPDTVALVDTLDDDIHGRGLSGHAVENTPCQCGRSGEVFAYTLSGWGPTPLSALAAAIARPPLQSRWLCVRCTRLFAAPTVIPSPTGKWLGLVDELVSGQIAAALATPAMPRPAGVTWGLAEWDALTAVEF